MLAVGQHKHTQLHAVEVLLHHHLRRGLPELTLKHFTQLVPCLVEVVQNQHPLACRQAVGLQHVRRLQGAEESLALRRLACRERAVSRRGDPVALHKLLGKILAALQLGARLAGSHHHHIAEVAVGGEKVRHPRHQRRLGTHHQHIDIVLMHHRTQRLEIQRVHIHIAAFIHAGRTGVAGSHIQGGAAFALRNTAGDSMFTPT